MLTTNELPRGRPGQGPLTLIGDLSATFALFVSTTGLAISLAVLIFAGPLVDGLPRATSAFLVGSGAVIAVIGWRSRIVPCGVVTQDAPGIVLAAVVASVVASRPGFGSTEAFVVAAAVVLASTLVALSLVALGATAIVRFVPATVLSGFVAGTGWLLLVGGFEVMAEAGSGLGSVDGLVAAWPRLAPGLVLGILAYLSTRSTRLPPAVPGLLVVLSLIGFWLVALAVADLETVERSGWLIGPFDGGVALDPLSIEEVRGADWGAIGSALPGLVSTVAIVVVALLLNLSALGSLMNEDIDVDGEVRLASLANLVQIPFGGIPAFHALSDTVLLRRMEVSSRGVPVLAGLASVAVGVFGTSIVGLTPRFVAGGLLLVIAFALFVEWFAELRATASRAERSLSVAIVMAIALFGVLPAVLLGIVAACGIFVVRYSRIDPIRSVRSLTTARSRVERTGSELERLAAGGEATQVVTLQGYLFFGSMVAVADRVDALVDASPVETVVFDLDGVSGVDASAAVTFARLGDRLSERDVEVVVAGGSDAARRLAPDREHLPDIDVALEQAEDRLLGPRASATIEPRPWLVGFTRRRVEAGEVVIRLGDPGDTLLYVMEGTLTTIGTDARGRRERLRRFSAPSWIGELGFVRRRPRMADVVADTPGEVAEITRQALDEMRASDPDLVVELFEDLLVDQSTRLALLSQAVVETPSSNRPPDSDSCTTARS